MTSECLENIDFDKILGSFLRPSPFGNDGKPHSVAIQESILHKHIAEELKVKDCDSSAVLEVIKYLIDANLLTQEEVFPIGSAYRLEFK